MTDIRLYVDVDYKKHLKTIAVQNGVPLSKLLLPIIKERYPATAEHDYRKELNDVLALLANSANMSAEKKAELKLRKEELKKIIAEKKI